MPKQTKQGKSGSGFDEDAIRNLASEYGGYKSDQEELSGYQRDVMERVEKQGGCNRQAFKLCMKLRRMDETKRAAFLEDLDRLVTLFGLDAQGQMFEHETQGADDAPLH